MPARIFSGLVGALSLGLLAACAAPPGWDRPAPPVPSEADKAALAEATQEALESNRNGESRNWAVEGTAHLGTVTPLRTYETEAGVPCREFQQTVTIGGRTQAAYGTACRDAEGTWTETENSGLSEVGPHGAYRYRRYGYPPYGALPYYHYGPRIHYGFGIGFGHGRFFHHRKHRHFRHYHRGYRYH